MREAKIKISADVASLKQTVNQAKSTLESLNRVKIDNESLNTIKKAFDQELAANIEATRKRIEEVNAKMNELGRTAEGALSKEFKQAAEDAKTLNRTLEDLNKTKKALADGKLDFGGQGMRGPGLMDRLRGGALKAAGVVGLGFGLNHLKDVAINTSKQRTGLRSLTGGADVGEESQLGFTPEERRERATTIAKALGREMSEEEITNVTNFGERAERAFGIEQGTLNSAMEQGRKAGVDDEQKMLASSMGTAIVNGLEGSRIGEYLSAMTGFMSEMADSITVSPDSINGFASAFGDIPFFKNDPSRLFSQMRGMDGAFRQGDRFQQAQAARAMLRSNRHANVADMELRRETGLFSDNSALAARYAEMGRNGHAGGAELAKTMSISGTDIMNNMFGESMGATSNMKLGDRVKHIMTRLGLQGEGGQMLAADIIEGKKVTSDDITKAQMSAEDQLKFKEQENLGKSFRGVEAKTLEMAASLKSIEEKMANNVAIGMTTIIDYLDKIAEKMGISNGTSAAANVATAGIAAIGANTAAKAVTGKSGAELLKKGAEKILPKAVGGGLGKGLGKVLPGVGTAYAMLESEEVGRGSDIIDQENDFEWAAAENKRSGGKFTTDAQIPFATGLSKKERNAASVNPVNVVASNPSAMELPEILKTTDSEAVGYLKTIAEALTGRRASTQIQERRPSGVMVFGSGKVGMNGL